MNIKRIRLAIIFGGRSAEHEVSIISAQNIVRAIDKERYNILLIGIDKRGSWFSFEEKEMLVDGFKFSQEGDSGLNTITPYTDGEKFLLSVNNSEKEVDVVFPVLHGPFGEDGTIQGLLEMFNVAFVGPDVLGSAVNMDKDVSKRLLRDAGIPISKFLTYSGIEKECIKFENIVKELGLPFFVKPANLGSSIGISKVEKLEEFEGAVEEAFSYDNKIVIEENIAGKEIECAVLGNENPIVSVPGEIVSNQKFYSYDAKYLDENGAEMAIPAKISKEQIVKIQELALKTFKTLCCEGMGRVDCFLTDKGEVFMNEINTIPGFTSISMYPKLWEESGVSYAELIDRLIELAMKRFERKRKLKIDMV